MHNSAPVWTEGIPVVKLQSQFKGEQLDFVCLKDAKTLVNLSCGPGPNPGPMQLILCAVATCPMVDMIDALKGAEFSGLRCDVSGQRSATIKGRPWERIHLEFHVNSKSLTDAAFLDMAHKALENSGVPTTLAGGPAKITVAAIVGK